ncbi:MAG: hypothetical protein JNK00_05775 [Flavipsychrobacter sp.]|nr:hypothetical protein [Flavipsychrobacter sp.]
MKQTIALIGIIACSIGAHAQSSNSSQTVTMGVSSTIELAFTGSNNAASATVNLNFNTVNDYANGVTSSNQELKVTSNRNFTVAVKTSGTHFSYTGSTSPAPAMPVGILGLMIASNATGGTIASPFSATAYNSLTSSNQMLLNTCTAGNSKLFAVKYKATPEFAYPAGTYTVDVLFTATQL